MTALFKRKEVVTKQPTFLKRHGNNNGRNSSQMNPDLLLKVPPAAMAKAGLANLDNSTKTTSKREEFFETEPQHRHPNHMLATSPAMEQAHGKGAVDFQRIQTEQNQKIDRWFKTLPRVPDVQLLFSDAQDSVSYHQSSAEKHDVENLQQVFQKAKNKEEEIQEAEKQKPEGDAEHQFYKIILNDLIGEQMRQAVKERAAHVSQHEGQRDHFISPNCLQRAKVLQSLFANHGKL